MPRVDSILLLHFLHLFSTGIMAGLIWFVQLVHYPLFSKVGDTSFHAYEQDHAKRTTWIVAPTMLCELITASLILLYPPSGLQLLAILGFCLVILVWLSTFFIQVPCHARLERGFSRKTHQLLVQLNWLRTAVWNVRFLVAIYLFMGAVT